MCREYHLLLVLLVVFTVFTVWHLLVNFEVPKFTLTQNKLTIVITFLNQGYNTGVV